MAWEISQKTKDKLAADAAHNERVLARFPVGRIVEVVRGEHYGTVGIVIKHYRGDYGTRTGGMLTTLLAQCGDHRLVLDLDLIKPVLKEHG